MLTVGEFSKICQVSVKTLHHYDKIGLLRPQKVDPLNGYRYYGKEQVEQMLLIMGLGLLFIRGQGNMKFVKVANAFFGRQLGAGLPLDLQKSTQFSHG